ncbi:MAG TPA: hypothetical protein PKX07_00925 [Aggregatilineales bacterium]|nr:hypothetical protein [Aggregatilineales bacterium]
MDEQLLANWRKETYPWVVAQLAAAPPVTFAAGPDRERIDTLIDGERVRLPKKPGIYVFYSRHTGRVLYVNEDEHLKRAVDHEIRPSGETVFKNRWVRTWLDLPRSRPMTRAEAEQAAAFVRDQMTLKYVELPFGRVEIAHDLLYAHKLRTGPGAVDPQEEFA